MPNAVLFDILTEVQTDIRDLNLTGMDDANVLVQKVPATRAKDMPATVYPCILIAPFGAEEMKAETNLHDLIVYPVIVAILASEKKVTELTTDQQTQNFNQYLTWRETIRKSFINQKLTTLAYHCEVRPLEIVERNSWFERSLFASGLVLRFFSRETRG